MKTFITAEIGINHGGSIDTALKLIDAAIYAGCDAVKFQKRDINTCYAQDFLDSPRESPWGTTQRDQKKGLEFGYDEYAEIDRYCKEKGIIWYASPWDIPSVKFLEQFNIPFYKISSACLTDHKLIKTCVDAGRHIFLSIGMSTEIQIYETIKIIKPSDILTLMVTTSLYPCPINHLNLRRIKFMCSDYWSDAHAIGYSHHAISPWPILGAVALGASAIEFHLTLDRTMYGSDQSASLEPHAAKKIITEIRDMELALGNGKIDIIPEEIPIMKKLRRVK